MLSRVASGRRRPHKRRSWFRREDRDVLGHTPSGSGTPVRSRLAICDGDNHAGADTVGRPMFPLRSEYAVVMIHVGARGVALALMPLKQCPAIGQSGELVRWRPASAPVLDRRAGKTPQGESPLRQHNQSTAGPWARGQQMSRKEQADDRRSARLSDLQQRCHGGEPRGSGPGGVLRGWPRSERSLLYALPLFLGPCPRLSKRVFASPMSLRPLLQCRL
jgi:hypothetical protein